MGEHPPLSQVPELAQAKHMIGQLGHAIQILHASQEDKDPVCQQLQHQLQVTADQTLILIHVRVRLDGTQ